VGKNSGVIARVVGKTFSQKQMFYSLFHKKILWFCFILSFIDFLNFIKQLQSLLKIILQLRNNFLTTKLTEKIRANEP